MSENFKPHSLLYKPQKSASAVANTQSVIDNGSTFQEENTRGAKRSFDGLDIDRLRKSAEQTGLSCRFGSYRGDDPGLDHLCRIDDGLSLGRLDGCKEGLSHGSLCRCTTYGAPSIDRFQDVASLLRRSVTDKISSVACHSDDYRGFCPDWNPVEPFPRVQFESIPFDVPVLHKGSFESGQTQRHYEALLSVISMKLETQCKTTEKLHNGLKRLEDERDTYTQLFRELRDEMISLNGQMIDAQASASLHHEVGVWKHQIVTEMHHLKANIVRFHDEGRDAAAESSSRVAELRHELSEMKKFLSDELEANRRETRKLHSRIGQLEIDMVGVFSENKDLHKRLQKLEKSVLSVVQSQSLLAQDLSRAQNEQTKERTNLQQLQRNHGCLLQKLNELTLKTCVVGSRGILRDVPPRDTDLERKTGSKSRSSKKKVESVALDCDNLDLYVTSESSSLTSLTDTMSTDNDKLAESRRGKDSSANRTTKKAKSKKAKAKKTVDRKKSKCVAKKGGGVESSSLLPDRDNSDSLTDVEVMAANPAVIMIDPVSGAVRNRLVQQKRLSGGMRESFSLLPDKDISDSLTGIIASPAVPMTDRGTGAVRNRLVEHRRLSGGVRESMSLPPHMNTSNLSTGLKAKSTTLTTDRMTNAVRNRHVEQKRNPGPSSESVVASRASTATTMSSSTPSSSSSTSTSSSSSSSSSSTTSSSSSDLTASS